MLDTRKRRLTDRFLQSTDYVTVTKNIKIRYSTQTEKI